MKRLFTILTFVIPIIGFSGNTDNFAPIYNLGDVLPYLEIEIDQEGVDPEKCENREDEETGWKQGYWCIWGKDYPDKGYEPDGKIEEGPYVDDRKNGEWIKYHKDGKTPRLIGEYVNNRPNGAYKKIYPNGQVMEEGSFSGGKQKGTFKRYYEDGTIAQEKNFNENGKEEGVQRYYYENGQVEFEFNKKDGVTTGKATRYYEDGSVKEEIVYGADGEVESSTPHDPPATLANNNSDEGSGGPKLSGNRKDGKPLECNGYNKVYNDNDELSMDGEFKSCKLWDGKEYIYDSDGILLKIKVYKNGKYISDGQL